MTFTRRVIHNIDGDRTEVYVFGDEVVTEAAVGGTYTTTMYHTVTQARELGNAILEAAAVAGEVNS